MRIAVASALDDGYTMPTEVMVESLLSSASEDTEYYIFLMVPRKYKCENKERLISLCKKFPGHSIKFIDMNDWFSDERIAISHITYPAYYRLLLPELLSEWDRCIYLDGDILVLEDLRELYQVDIAEYYVGGVKSPSYCLTNSIKEQNKRRLHIPDMDCYINSGVLLMNLQKLRKDQMIPCFLRMLEKEKEKTNDQDIINVRCYGKIKSLPFCYNYQLESSYLDRSTLLNIFTEKELGFSNDKPKILHYSNYILKPWSTLDYQDSDLWWKYFRRTSYAGEEWERKAVINEKRAEHEKRFEQFIKQLKNEKHIVVFGYSETGIELLKKLEADRVTVDCFCDNDRAKWGGNTDGIMVESLESCLSKYPGAFYIIASQNYAEEICTQLKGMGIPDDRVIKYRRMGYWLEKARKPGIRELYFW